MSLKTDYKNAMPPEEGRHWRMKNNADGTVSLSDETQYLQAGDAFGAADVNAITKAVNANEENIEYFRPRILKPEVKTDYFFPLPEGFTEQNCMVIAAVKDGFQTPVYTTFSDGRIWASTALSNGETVDEILVQRF